MTTTPPSPESDEGPNHAAWEQFAAVMESLADTMDDGPMVTNEQGVEFLDALARRGYEVRPHASPTLARAIALGLAWQRASAALPDGWMLQCGMTVWPEPERRYAAVAHKRDWRPVGWTNEHVTIHADDHRDANGPTPEAALIALAEALEARRG